MTDKRICTVHYYSSELDIYYKGNVIASSRLESNTKVEEIDYTQLMRNKPEEILVSFINDSPTVSSWNTISIYLMQALYIQDDMDAYLYRFCIDMQRLGKLNVETDRIEEWISKNKQ